MYGVKYNTYEEAMEAVEDNSYYLQHVREDLQTEEMCIYAVKDWDYNLQYVRKDLQTFEICCML